MKYALLIYGASLVPEASDAETREGWIDYARAAKEAGILLGAEQLAGTDTATSVRVRGGQRLLTDGPFLETKEHLGGFFLIDVPDLDTALDWISGSGIRFEVPGADRWAARLDDVRAVIYLVFNEGYAASGGEQLIHADLCEEAIWLGRLLHRLLPEDAETVGLLALMLLHHSRAVARQDPGGGAVLLADQDRTRWDAALIAEGTAILDAAVPGAGRGPTRSRRRSRRCTRRRAVSRRPTGRRSRRCTARWPGFPRPRWWRSTGPWRSAWPTARTPGWRSWNRSSPLAR